MMPKLISHNKHHTGGSGGGGGGNPSWDPAIISQKTGDAWEAAVAGGTFNGTYSSVVQATVTNYTSFLPYGSLFFKNGNINQFVYAGIRSTTYISATIVNLDNTTVDNGNITVPVTSYDTSSFSAYDTGNSRVLATYHANTNGVRTFLLAGMRTVVSYDIVNGTLTNMNKYNISTKGTSDKYSTLYNINNGISYWSDRVYDTQLNGIGSGMTFTDTSNGQSNNALPDFPRFGTIVSYDNSVYPKSYYGIPPSIGTNTSKINGMRNGQINNGSLITHYIYKFVDNSATYFAYDSGVSSINNGNRYEWVNLHIEPTDNDFALIQYGITKSGRDRIVHWFRKKNITSGTTSGWSTIAPGIYTNVGFTFDSFNEGNFSHYLGRSSTGNEYILTCTIGTTGSEANAAFALCLVRVNRPAGNASVYLLKSFTYPRTYHANNGPPKFSFIPYYDNENDPVYNRVMLAWPNTDAMTETLWNFQTISV